MSVVSEWLPHFLTVGASLCAVVAYAVKQGTKNESQEKQITELWLQLNEAKRNHSEHRLYVAEKYASVDHLKEVETRILGRLDELRDDVRGIRNSGGHD